MSCCDFYFIFSWKSSQTNPRLGPANFGSITRIFIIIFLSLKNHNLSYLKSHVPINPDLNLLPYLILKKIFFIFKSLLSIKTEKKIQKYLSWINFIENKTKFIIFFISWFYLLSLEEIYFFLIKENIFIKRCFKVFFFLMNAKHCFMCWMSLNSVPKLLKLAQRMYFLSWNFF